MALTTSRDADRQLSDLVVKSVGFEGTVEFDASKPDGTPRKLISVDKLHSLGDTQSGNRGRSRETL